MSGARATEILRPAVRIAAAIALTGALLVVLDRLLAGVTVGGEGILPWSAYEFAIVTVTIQYSDTHRSLGEDARDRILSTLLGCALGGALWFVAGETLLGVAVAVALGWLAGGLLPADFAPRTGAGVAGVIALGAGSDALSVLASRTLAILAATVATTLVLWFVWPAPSEAAETDPGG